jgi:hypothetical protein
MPETAMDKDYGTMRREYNIRLPRQVFAVEPVSQSGRVQESADRQLRLRVPPLNGSHIPTACLGINDVHCLDSSPNTTPN